MSQKPAKTLIKQVVNFVSPLADEVCEVRHYWFRIFQDSLELEYIIISGVSQILGEGTPLSSLYIGLNCIYLNIKDRSWARCCRQANLFSQAPKRILTEPWSRSTTCAERVRRLKHSTSISITKHDMYLQHCGSVLTSRGRFRTLSLKVQAKFYQHPPYY